MIDESRLIDLFLSLCRINSPALQERQVVDWTRAYIESAGFDVREDDARAKIGGNSGNLIVTLPGNLPNAARIFLSAHFDTVEPTEGLKIVEDNGVFKSGGDTILGADDKAGMAPAIEALRVLRDSGEPHGDVLLLLSVAEEIGLKGAEALAVETLGLDYGFVLDTGPPVGSFVNRTATHDKLDILIKGRPAHAGKDPENGINAIAVAADAIHGMKLGRIGPETTSNLGIIEGGTAVNVVCPFVKVRGEARSTSVKDLDDQVGHMVQRFEEAASKWGAEVEVDHHRHYRSYQISPEAKVAQAAAEASRRAGFTPAFRTTLGGSDANIYNAKGIPTLVVATGMQKIHTHEEQVSRKDLIDTTRLCLELIRGC